MCTHRGSRGSGPGDDQITTRRRSHSSYSYDATWAGTTQAPQQASPVPPGIIAERSPSPPTMTPAELLPAERCVAPQIAEHERLREGSPRRDAEAMPKDNPAPAPLNPEASDPDEPGLSLLSFELEDGFPSLQLLAKRDDEVSLKDMSQAERERFQQADELEWSAIVKTKAVKVLTGREAAEARQKFGHRIISSRMVRRGKPMPGEGNWKPKSRWCLHGRVFDHLCANSSSRDNHDILAVIGQFGLQMLLLRCSQCFLPEQPVEERGWSIICRTL